MNNRTQIQSSPLTRWHSPLTSEGFEPCGAAYVSKGISVASVGEWLELRIDEPHSVANLPGHQLGHPGFWKQIFHERQPFALFEFPQEAVGAGEESADGEFVRDTSLGAYLRWALATRTNSTPPEWRSPPLELIQSWMFTGALTVQHGPIVRQGKLILTPKRWALEFTICPKLPAVLPPARRKRLEAVLADAQHIWRMVRVGIVEGPEHPAVLAELDFTGAPPSEFLFSAGLQGIRHVVAWLVESVEFVSDANVASQALSINPHSNPKPERKNK